MKNIITIALLTLSTTCVFAQENDTATNQIIQTMTAPAPLSKKGEKDSLCYLRMGVSPLQAVGAIPGIGIGYRLYSGSTAVDFSTSVNGLCSEDAKAFTYMLPKANYLYFLTPAEKNSVYFGAGLGWGGIYKKTEAKEEFNGLIANASLGYEIERKEDFRSFVQLDLNQPTIAASKQSAFPGPSAELAAGIGF